MRMKKLLCGALLGLTIALAGVGSSTVVKAEETTELDLNSDAVFPDAEFREYLTKFDTDADGKLSETEVAEITIVSVPGNEKITDLTGIENLTAMQYLDCDNTGITSLDVSACKSLNSL